MADQKQRWTKGALAKAAIQVGHVMEDGTLFSGISPVTDEPIFACPEDAPLPMIWDEAIEYAGRYEGLGYPAGTFRLPKIEEKENLFALFTATAAFDESNNSKRDFNQRYDYEQRYWMHDEAKGDPDFRMANSLWLMNLRPFPAKLLAYHRLAVRLVKD